MSGTINPQEFKAVIGNEYVAVIDVRRKDDYAADKSAIPGAIWLDPEHIDNWSDTLTKGKEVILYCVRGDAVSNNGT